MKVVSTHLRLHHLHFYAYHGVLPQEHVVGGEYEVNVEITFTPTPEAFEGDRLEGTLDYAAVYADLKEAMATPCALLEHVAWQMARSLLNHFQCIEQVTLAVCKLCPPMSADFGGAEVEITARRD